MRLRARTDSNQEAIASALEKCGAKVERKLARLGFGIPDLLCWYDHHWTLLEIKMPGEKLTPAEVKWHEKFPGAKVVSSIDEAFQAVGIAIRKEIK